jgi:3-deoxy-D-manno-octulosonic-acid transferase
MFFYLGLADHVTVGGSFSPQGSHNIIEPIALRKPVTVGPEIWTIEYPAVEALEAGLVQVIGSPSELDEVWLQLLGSDQISYNQAAQNFLAVHGGSTAKHIHQIHTWLDAA